MPTHFLLRNAGPGRIGLTEIALEQFFKGYGTIGYTQKVEHLADRWDAEITTPLPREETIEALRKYGFQVQVDPFGVENLGMVVK